MEQTKKIVAQVIVKATTEMGRIVLQEIHGLKEGTKLDGYYIPSTKAFEFEWNDLDAVLYVGQNCELLTLGEGQRFKYMMLDRLLCDCHYLLTAKETNEKSLYYHNIARHMGEMRKLWDEVNLKPQWLTRKEIGRLEHKMNRELARRNTEQKRKERVLR